MGIYTRYKRESGGFRALVELMERTPLARRQKMIDAGMKEDPDFTERALSLLMSFEDILGMNESELAEVVAKTVPRITAMAIAPLSKEVQDRFLRCAKPPVAVAIRDFLGAKVVAREVGGAQLQMVGVARELEKRGIVQTKKIPTSA